MHQIALNVSNMIVTVDVNPVLHTAPVPTNLLTVSGIRASSPTAVVNPLISIRCQTRQRALALVVACHKQAGLAVYKPPPRAPL
jgi:hypothetical protein